MTENGSALIRRWIFPSLRWLRIALFLALDSTLASLRPARRGGAALVIRLDAIGDFVIWLQSGAADIAHALRKEHPRVILLANAAWADMARDLQLWDEVVAIDGNRYVRDLRYRLKSLWMIRGLGAATVVQPRAARLFLLEDAIVRVCGVPTRIGSAALDANSTPALRRLGDRAYTRIVPVPLELTVHESARDRAFAMALCVTCGPAVAPPAHNGALPTEPVEPFWIAAIGAGWSGRQWPLEKFAALLNSLHESHGLLCVVIGSKAEQTLVAQLQALTAAPIKDLCGRLLLADSVRLVQRARLVVANESGPLHIAAWCGVPAVGLVGGGHFGWFAPYPDDFPLRAPLSIACKPMPCYHCNWHCQFDVPPGSAVPCVRDIDVDDVIARARRLLESA